MGVLAIGINGMVVITTTHTYLSLLTLLHNNETGVLLGAPLRERLAECGRATYCLMGGVVPIIGVGGVGYGRDVYEKLWDGAPMVQVYNMLVYKGPGMESRIRKNLVDLLAKNRYRSVEDVVGADRKDIYWRRREESVRRLMQEKGKMEQEIAEL